MSKVKRPSRTGGRRDTLMSPFSHPSIPHQQERKTKKKIERHFSVYLWLGTVTDKPIIHTRIW
jgi:hypothetical protein